MADTAIPEDSLKILPAMLNLVVRPSVHLSFAWL